MVRYLSDIFNYAMNAHQSLLLGCYIVAQAKRYIDGCGGPIQAYVINKGKVLNESGLANRLDPTQIEEPIRDLILVLSNKDNLEEQREEALRNFWREIQKFDWIR